jgi:hypothetical protein
VSIVTYKHRFQKRRKETMANFASCFECLFQQHDARLKYLQEQEDTESCYSDEDSSYASSSDEEEEDADDESDDESSTADEDEQVQEQGKILQKLVKGTNLFENINGRHTAFQGAMKRGEEGDAPAKGANGKKVILAVQTSLPSEKTDSSSVDCDTKPKDALKSILTSNGYTSDTRSYQSLKAQGFFVVQTPAQIEAYDMTVVGAVRSNDLDAIRELHKTGKDFQCCNQFHESILHTIGRRGLTDILKFLLNETAVSLRVCCASGRTPLHDACWTTAPNFDCVRVILEDSPDFLLIGDNRMFTPLDYVPRECWGQWCTFLEENHDLLKPTVLL